MPHLRPSKIRQVATALVIGMGLGFLVSKYFEIHHGHLLWGYVRAFCEAGLIGALADWFAVVALFRHPLGQKWIPHTAIIPKNKEKIAKSVSQFFQQNFFDPQQLGEHLRSYQLLDRLYAGLSSKRTLESTSLLVHKSIPKLVRVIDDSDLKLFMSGQIKRLLQQLPLASLSSKLLQTITDSGKHQVAFDHTLRLAGGLLEENVDFVQERIEIELKRVPAMLGLKHVLTRQIAAKIVSNVQASLESVIHDPNHPIRDQFHLKAIEFIQELNEDPELIQKTENLKAEFLNSPSISDTLESLWAQFRDHVLSEDYLNSSTFREQLNHGLSQLLSSFTSDEAMKSKLESWLEKSVVHLIQKYGHEIERMIERTILAWDEQEVASKLEEHVGDDLQYIRINGSLVGGSVGLIIHGLLHSLGWH